MLTQRKIVAQKRHIAQIGQRKAISHIAFLSQKYHNRLLQIIGIELEKINIEDFANPE